MKIAFPKLLKTEELKISHKIVRKEDHMVGWDIYSMRRFKINLGQHIRMMVEDAGCFPAGPLHLNPMVQPGRAGSYR